MIPVEVQNHDKDLKIKRLRRRIKRLNAEIERMENAPNSNDLYEPLKPDSFSRVVRSIELLSRPEDLPQA